MGRALRVGLIEFGSLRSVFAPTGRDSIVFFAPTGQDSIAQGNALGTRRHRQTTSPNGARFGNRITRVIAPRIESRPVGVVAFVVTETQGCALGYRMWPRWGRTRGYAASNQTGGLGRAIRVGLVAVFFAPTGQDSIAQGNALGTRRHRQTTSPNGARFGNRITRVIAPRIESRPVGVVAFVVTETQGCALGYRMWPRWGRTRGYAASNQTGGLGRAIRVGLVAVFFAPTGSDSIAQGNALGTRRHRQTASPNGARFGNGIARVIAPRIESRPVGALGFVVTVTQGSALGYRMRPRWGQERDARLAA